MESLKFLFLGPEKITVYPPLTALPVGGNDFMSIPDCICNLTRLKELNLAATHISELPACMSRFKRLEVLHLSLNPGLKLGEAIPIIADMKSLKHLGIYGTSYSQADTVQLKALNPNLKIFAKIW